MSCGEDLYDIEDTDDIDEEDGCDYGFEFCGNPQTKDMGLCTTECRVYLVSVEADADGSTASWVCEKCGCTDSTPCPGGCTWVRKNLCSSCYDFNKFKPKQQRLA